MRYRFAQLSDVPQLLVLYDQMLTENAGNPAIIQYPRRSALTPLEMSQYVFTQLTTNARDWVCLVAVIGAQQGPDGAVRGGKAKGMITGTIYERAVGEPKRVGYCELLFVDPKFRGGRGAKAIAVQLIRRIAEEATRRYPDIVLEGGYVPGSHGEKLWPRLGLKPYVVYCAYVHEDGTPRQQRELFMRKAG